MLIEVLDSAARLLACLEATHPCIKGVISPMKSLPHTCSLYRCTGGNVWKPMSFPVSGSTLARLRPPAQHWLWICVSGGMASLVVPLAFATQGGLKEVRALHGRPFFTCAAPRLCWQNKNAGRIRGCQWHVAGDEPCAAVSYVFVTVSWVSWLLRWKKGSTLLHLQRFALGSLVFRPGLNMASVWVYDLIVLH